MINKYLVLYSFIDEYDETRFGYYFLEDKEDFFDWLEPRQSYKINSILNVSGDIDVKEELMDNFKDWISKPKYEIKGIFPEKSVLNYYKNK